MMRVGEITEKMEEGFEPKSTALADSKPLPITVTMAPPPADTEDGLSASTEGPPTTGDAFGGGELGDGLADEPEWRVRVLLVGAEPGSMGPEATAFDRSAISDP